LHQAKNKYQSRVCGFFAKAYENLKMKMNAPNEWTKIKTRNIRIFQNDFFLFYLEQQGRGGPEKCGDASDSQR
jgi:hypothetical protein